MKSKNRILLIAFSLAVLAILGALGGVWYYTSHMDRSGWVQQSGYYYYLDEKGTPISGWMEEDGSIYYFGQSSAMVTGWQDIGGGRYFFGSNGVMRTGWVEDGGVRHYLMENGVAAQGWQNVDGLRRYFLADGVLATGWQEFDGSYCFLTEDGTVATGWLEQPEGTYYLGEQGSPVVGLNEIDEKVYYFFEGSGLMAQGMVDLPDGSHYFGADGTQQTGWQTIDSSTYYFEDSGIMHTGWMEEDGYRYYFNENGTMAVTPTVIDGETCYFTPAGIYVLLVNFRNAMPESYKPNLSNYNGWARVDQSIDANLRRMILDCRATGVEVWLNCGYRSREEQNTILNDRTKEYQNKGLSYQEAYDKALETVALPGYSEHETGLAVDIVGSEMLTWLHEHCWEYGFILRYPEGKEDITGIVYEHWHYRYVGTKVSMAMKGTGLTLEEYVGAA